MKLYKVDFHHHAHTLRSYVVAPDPTSAEKLACKACSPLDHDQANDYSLKSITLLAATEVRAKDGDAIATRLLILAE